MGLLPMGLLPMGLQRAGRGDAGACLVTGRAMSLCDSACGGLRRAGCVHSGEVSSANVSAVVGLALVGRLPPHPTTYLRELQRRAKRANGSRPSPPGGAEPKTKCNAARAIVERLCMVTRLL
jgi:hypothetical protein